MSRSDLHTPFRFTSSGHPCNDFHVVKISGREALSQTYSFDITFACRVFEPQLDDLVGKSAWLALSSGDESPRCVHGVLALVAALGAPRGVPFIRAKLVPRLWLLKRRMDSRVFQHKTVPQIVAVVLDGADVPHRWQTTRAYAPREYCVQYQETDFAFITRLLAEEGLFFRFHQPPPSNDAGLSSGEEQEQVVFCDAAIHYQEMPGSTTLPRSDAGALVLGECVQQFELARTVQTGRVRVLGYDYCRPAFVPSAVANAEQREQPVELESYQHDRVLEPTIVPAHVAELRLEEQRRGVLTAEGKSNCRRLEPGRWFDLLDTSTGHQPSRHAVVEVRHRGQQPLPEQDVEAGDRIYENEFVCLPVAVPFRPRRRRRALRQVVETATVVGPAGEEIYTDELGRIKVQFRWDRQGRRNEHSSCWVRPLQAWAGAAWGTQFLPRIGMEVLVGFVGGDTDRPTVLGCHYNGANPPPFKLPDEKTSSGFRTRSTPGGAGCNELIFEDAANAEQIYVHAQRDLDELIENDRSQTVRGVLSITVASDRVVDVGGDNVRMVAGNETVLISGNLVIDIAGSQVIRVGGGAAANPRVREAAERMKEVSVGLVEAKEQRATLAALAVEAERSRDAKILSIGEELSGDHQRAARILMRQMTELREAQRLVDTDANRLLSALDDIRIGYLAGTVAALPLETITSAADLTRRVEQLEQDAIRRIHESTTPVAVLEPLQALVRADMEDTLGRTQRARDTMDLVRMFLDGMLGARGGSVDGGGAAPPGFAKATVAFSKYDDAKGDAPSAKAVDGSKFDVKDAVEIIAGSGIKLSCGGSTIEMTPGNITITSPSIDITATGTCAIKGAPVNINC
ncbi:MAG: type VI secretion system tip protein VgrG [Myxococcales bacterium]|nr:type VI secretion system tip protein VgrG [Myxococcales bacterium]